jgi:hypothetical protein
MFWRHNVPYKELPIEMELRNDISRTSIPNLPQTWKQRHLQGWRFGVLSGSLLASFVFVLNISITAGVSSLKDSSFGGRKVLHTGSCQTTRQLNIAAHLLINILSTALLSASNFGMQCLSAPTRKEVDAAHAVRKWLDIGVLSIRNIGKISLKRSMLWALLGASSLPLHLL